MHPGLLHPLEPHRGGRRVALLSVGADQGVVRHPVGLLAGRHHLLVPLDAPLGVFSPGAGVDDRGIGDGVRPQAALAHLLEPGYSAEGGAVDWGSVM